MDFKPALASCLAQCEERVFVEMTNDQTRNPNEIPIVNDQ
jgi:hypothetical protein